MLTAGVAVGGGGVAQADTAPPDPSIPATVSADALPTVQVDGVVWAQAVVGNRVYAGGRFTTARPAGAAPGTNTTPRGNLLAYDITTGALVTSFAPTLNGQVLAVTPSPDGSRIYVGGEFTEANGAARYRIAAYNTSDGSLVGSFRPSLDFRVRALAVTDDTVYVGGGFSTANGNARSRLAAFRTSDGALLPWAPSADAQVFSMVMAPDRSKLVVGGSFMTVNGTAAHGMTAVDPTTGAVLPWAANTVVKNGGSDSSAINSLSADGGLVYGTGFKTGTTSGNFEGTFAADPATGKIVWLEDCHGDTYSNHPSGDAVYTVGHAHFCGNIGGFPSTEPKSHHRALAFSRAATGKVARNTVSGYSNFGGQPAPSLLTWFPEIDAGTFTGQNQGAWSVSGSGDYIVLGGEFPRVNRTAQQGLVRFAVRRIAPNDQGPRLTGSNFVPTLVSQSAGTARVSWTANWDRDNELLTYEVVRDGNTAAPVFKTTARSTFWNRPLLGFHDSGLTPGQSYRYRLRVTDPLGNTVSGDERSVVVSSTSPSSAYADAVRADGASSQWRLGESSGSVAYDTAGFADLVLGSTVSRGAAGAIADDPDRASTFDGTSTGTAGTTHAVPAPNTFSTEAWFRTTSTAGGKITGFGDASTGLSKNYDRHVYMDGTGRVSFGLNPGSKKVLTSAGSYNDGEWHHVVATLGSGGSALYLDGVLVGSNSSVTSGQSIPAGYWRVGGDNLNNWPASSGRYFAGTIDEVAVYPTALTATQVQKHFTTSGPSTADANAAPAAAFTAATSGLTASVDASTSKDSDGTITSYSWSFGDGTSGTGVKASRTYAAAGTYTVRLTVTDDKGATATASKNVTVEAPTVNAAPVASFTSTVSGLTASVDASGSSDDGSISSYAWDFGDGTKGTGVKAQRTYAAAGTYTVTLTVTDDQGLTGTTKASVTVQSTTTTQPFAADAFSRTVSGGWGSADTGGAWTIGGSAANTSVASGTGRTTMASAGAQLTAFLNDTSASDTDLRLAVALDKAATGGGTYLSVIGRKVGTSGDYRAKLRFQDTGAVALSLVRKVSSTQTTLASATLAGVTYSPGQVLHVRLRVVGTGTTSLAVKVWPAGAAEPTSWQLSATDSTTALQSAGSLGIESYLSGSSTNAPVTALYDALDARPSS